MKHLILGCALALSFTLSTPLAQAEPTEPSAQPSAASIEHLLDIMEAQKTVQTARQQARERMKPMVDQLLANKELTDEQRDLRAKFLARFTAKFDKILDDMLSWELMQRFYMAVYRDSFTQQEIDGLIAFYESPAGRAYTAKMPQLQQKISGFMQQQMLSLIQRTKAAAAESLAEMKPLPQKKS